MEYIEDRRHESYIEHKLTDILLIIIMCAVIRGVEDLGEVVSYAKNKEKFLHRNFGIEKTPSKATLSRVLNIINGEKVAKVIIEIMKESKEDIGKIIAVDGKAIKGSAKKGKPNSAL